MYQSPDEDDSLFCCLLLDPDAQRFIIRMGSSSHAVRARGNEVLLNTISEPEKTVAGFVVSSPINFTPPPNIGVFHM